MIRPVRCLAIVVCLLATPLISQQADLSSSTSGVPDGSAAETTTTRAASVEPLKPFSHFALGGGISIMGINLQAATNVNAYSNIRISGNVFKYSVNNIDTNGFKATGNLDLASMGASFDVFPWARHGFRLSPGLLMYNGNSLSASATETAGESFTLNQVDYYSSASDPIRARATVSLNAVKPAFTLTTGWGNMVARKGNHWSFPFELGAAFVGSPSFGMTLAGTACDAFGQSCVNAATDPKIQSDLKAQIAKYKKDVEPMKVYPILSIGVSYSFKIGPR